jgi:hypothetical protein
MILPGTAEVLSAAGLFAVRRSESVGRHDNRDIAEAPGSGCDCEDRKKMPSPAPESRMRDESAAAGIS